MLRAGRGLVVRGASTATTTTTSALGIAASQQQQALGRHAAARAAAAARLLVGSRDYHGGVGRQQVRALSLCLWVCVGLGLSVVG